MKICAECRQPKELNRFSPDRRKKDGKQARCKDCRKAAQAMRYAENPEREKNCIRNAVAKKPLYYIERAKERLAVEPIERVRARGTVRNNNRRARLAATLRTITAKQWRDILAYFNGRCAYCLNEGKMTQDHVIPLSRGGTHTPDNIVPACGRCNRRKSDRPLWAMI